MKRMLINATQPEERRLAIVDGQKLLDFAHRQARVRGLGQHPVAEPLDLRPRQPACRAAA